MSHHFHGTKQPIPKNPTMLFLGLFNDIDKFFDTLLDNPKFLPYNEKIKIIKESNLPIAHYVMQHEYLLKFFGEVRNHISHGIKIDGHSFTVPSEHAIKRIDQCRNVIVTPPQASEFFKKKVYSCYKDDSCKKILPEIIKNSHIPVYNKGKIEGIINQKLVTHRLIKHSRKGWEDKIIDDLPIKEQLESYNFITPDTDIHEILHYFIKAKKEKKDLKALFMTKDGKKDSQLLGIITSGDLAIIEDSFQHKIVD